MYSNGLSRRLIRYLFAERQGFLLRKRYAITNPSGFSSRLSSHEGPKACASGPSLRKDRDSCSASATRFLAPQALRDNEPIRVLIPPFFARRSESLRFRTFFAERQGFEPWVPARAQRFSRPPRSTTPASFRISHAVARVVLWVQRY